MMKTKYWTSHHDLSAAVREPMIDLLNRQLADVIDLGLQAKQAHWNVKGPHFASLHGFFDDAAEILEDLADELAERAVAMGGLARGTVQQVAAASRLLPYPADLLAGTQHLGAFTAALAACAETTRAAIDAAAAAGDADTADVFTQVSRSVDKLMWQTEAHLQPDP